MTLCHSFLILASNLDEGIVVHVGALQCTPLWKSTECVRATDLIVQTLSRKAVSENGGNAIAVISDSGTVTKCGSSRWGESSFRCDFLARWPLCLGDEVRRGMEDRFSPDDCVALLEEAQCEDADAADTALRRVALNAAAPHPAVSAAALQLAVVHPAVTIPHIPDIISASAQDVDAAISTFADLLQADRTLLVPIIGALADMPLSVTHRAQARATLSFALDTVDDDDLPTVVRTVIRAASTPALARWAAPALRTSLARVQSPDVVLVVGLTLIQACRAHPLVTRALLELHLAKNTSESHLRDVPQLTWLDIVTWSLALEFRTVTAYTGGLSAANMRERRDGSVLSVSCTTPQPANGVPRSVESGQSMVARSIHAFLSITRGCAAHPETAIEAADAAALVLERLPEGARRLVAFLAHGLPSHVDPRPVIGVICRLVEKLPAIAADVVLDVSQLSARPSTSTHPLAKQQSLLPHELLPALATVVRPTICSTRNGTKLSPTVVVRMIENRAKKYSRGRSSVGAKSSLPRQASQSWRHAQPSAASASSSKGGCHESLPEIDDGRYADVFISVRKGLVFGDAGEVRYSLALAESVIRHGPASTVGEMISVLDNSLPSDLSEYSAIHMLHILCQSTLRMDNALKCDTARMLYSKRIASQIAAELLDIDVTHRAACSSEEGVFCGDLGCNINVINIDTARIYDVDPRAAAIVVTTAVALSTHFAPREGYEGTAQRCTAFGVKQYAQKTRHVLSVNVLLPETCAALYDASEFCDDFRSDSQRGQNAAKRSTCDRKSAKHSSRKRRDEFEPAELLKALQTLAIGMAVLLRTVNYASDCMSEELLTHFYAAVKKKGGVSDRDFDSENVWQCIDLLTDRSVELFRMHRAFTQGLLLLQDQQGAYSRLDNFSDGRNDCRGDVRSLYAIAGALQKSFGNIFGFLDVDPAFRTLVSASLENQECVDLYENFPCLSMKSLLLALICVSGSYKESDVIAEQSNLDHVYDHFLVERSVLSCLARGTDSMLPIDQRNHQILRSRERTGMPTTEVSKDNFGEKESCPSNMSARTGSSSTVVDSDTGFESRSGSDNRHEKGTGEVASSEITFDAHDSMHARQFCDDEFFGDEPVNTSACTQSKPLTKRSVPSGSCANSSYIRSKHSMCNSCVGSLGNFPLEFSSSRTDALDIEELDILKSPVVIAVLLERAKFHALMASDLRKVTAKAQAGSEYVRECIFAALCATRVAVILMEQAVDYPWRGAGDIFVDSRLDNRSESCAFTVRRDSPMAFASQVESLLNLSRGQLRTGVENGTEEPKRLGESERHLVGIAPFLNDVLEISIDPTLSALVGDALSVACEMDVASQDATRETLLDNVVRVHEVNTMSPSRELQFCFNLPEPGSVWASRHRECSSAVSRSSRSGTCNSFRVGIGGKSCCPWMAERYRLLGLLGGMSLSEAVCEALGWVSDVKNAFRFSSVAGASARKRSLSTSGYFRDGRNDTPCALLDTMGVEPVLEVVVDVCQSAFSDIQIPVSMSVQRANRPGNSPVWYLYHCVMLLHELFAFNRNYVLNVARQSVSQEPSRRSQEVIRKAFPKLTQGVVSAQLLVSQVRVWYSDSAVCVSELSTECIAHIRSIASVGSAIVAESVALANDLKVLWHLGQDAVEDGRPNSQVNRKQARHSSRFGRRRSTFHADAKSLMRFRRLIPRLLLHADKLGSTCELFITELNLDPKSVENIVASESVTHRGGVGAVIRSWRQRVGHHRAPPVCDEMNDGSEQDFRSSDGSDNCSDVEEPRRPNEFFREVEDLAPGDHMEPSRKRAFEAVRPSDYSGSDSRQEEPEFNPDTVTVVFRKTNSQV